MKICLVDCIYSIHELWGNCLIQALNTREPRKLTSPKYKAFCSDSSSLVCTFAKYCNFPTIFTTISPGDFEKASPGGLFLYLLISEKCFTRTSLAVAKYLVAKIQIFITTDILIADSMRKTFQGLICPLPTKNG